jgi:hypothetical protein
VAFRLLRGGSACEIKGDPLFGNEAPADHDAKGLATQRAKGALVGRSLFFRQLHPHPLFLPGEVSTRDEFVRHFLTAS